MLNLVKPMHNESENALILYSLKTINNKPAIEILRKYNLIDFENNSQCIIKAFTIANAINNKESNIDEKDKLTLKKSFFMENIQYDYYIFNKE